jgi:hypothetical protein
MEKTAAHPIHEMNMAEVYQNGYVDSLVRERDRYREALRRICDPKECDWLAARMYGIAMAALNHPQAKPGGQ